MRSDRDGKTGYDDIEQFEVASSDGVTLAAYDLGGDGPPLLFCHATGFCGMIWLPLARALRSRFHCYSFDFRAHGQSTAPKDDDMAWSGMGDDILAVAEAVSPGRPMFGVGHSLGGGSLVLAESFRPGTFTACWAYEPILFPPPPAEEGPGAPHPSEMSEMARRRRAVFSSRDEVVQRYRSRPPLNDLDPLCLQAYVDYGFTDLDDGTVALACAPEHEAKTFEQHRTGADTLIGSLTIPYAIAIGTEKGRPVDAVLDVSKRFPELGLVRYPDLNHFGPLQEPERVATDIGDWFESTAMGSTAPG